MDGNVADRSARSDEAAATIHRFEFDVPWPPGHVAAYLIEDDEPILVDAAIHGDSAAEHLEDLLADIDFSLEDIAHVLVTHPHTDHIGLVSNVHSAGATIHAPEPVLDQLDRDEDSLVEGVGTVAKEVGYEGDDVEKAVEQSRYSLQRNRMLLDPAVAEAVDVFGEFTVGDRTFEPIHTPDIRSITTPSRRRGGRPDLFSGDALIEPFRAGIIHVGIDHGAFEALEAFHLAMDRLEGREIARVYPGHGPIFDNYDEIIDTTRGKLDKLANKTEAAVEAVEPATPIEITEERFGEILYPGNPIRYRGGSRLARDEGRVTHEKRDGVRNYRID
ncbi:MAG: MBL fold metallo-hydrolase [Natrialbaceae archaeon]|nr:MBL fold metallo-hydrolase [Natrialbaceae archaeon]